MTTSVYHLRFDLERKIVVFPREEELKRDFDFDDEFTPETYRADLQKRLNCERSGRVHLATGKTSAAAIRQKATEELKKLITDAFYDVCLPDISVVQQAHDNEPVDEAATVIQETADEDGHPKWSWKFRALDLNANNQNHGTIHEDTKCMLQCTGTVTVEQKKFRKMVDSHVLRFDMKRSIRWYGDVCYTDCRPSEMEDAEEHFDGELGYEQSGEKVIGYRLQETDDVNGKASDLVKKMFDEYLGDMGDLDVREVDCTDEAMKIEHQTPLVFRYIVSETGFARWQWRFAAKEEEYDCNMECQGLIEIIPKQTPNPKIPKETKKRRRSALKAPRKCRVMCTNINYIPG